MTGWPPLRVYVLFCRANWTVWGIRSAIRPASFLEPVAKFREYLPRLPFERKTRSPTLDVAIWGDGVMEIDQCSDGGRPNPVEGTNSRNFLSRHHAVGRSKFSELTW